MEVFSIKVSILTDKGLVRDSNQDSCCLHKFSELSALVIICDGMGGAAGGNIASQSAVDTIYQKMRENFDNNMDSLGLKAILMDAVFAANKAIRDKAALDPTLRGMGTTVTAILIRNNVAHIVNVGDSRAYLVSDTGIYQITKDHSMVQEMLDRGQITETQAKMHPKKNIITRALGVSENIDVDYFELQVEKGNKIFACTDGFSNYIPEDKMLQVINNTEFNKIADTLVNLANEAGGEDNITVAVMCCN